MARRTWQIIDGGRDIKASLLWDEETDAWEYISNAPTQRVSQLYRTIPTLWRGITIIMNEVQNMPLTVYDARGDEVDNTSDWQNALGFLPRPRQLFGLISQALDRHGAAYLLRAQNRAGIVKELRWLSPISIEPVFDLATGALLRFTRMVGTQISEIAPKDTVYFWLPDSDIELGPPRSWPLMAALQAAGVLHNLDSYINLYFERGAIRPIIISAKGMPSPQERERLESWFNRLMGGIRRAFQWKVFNADTVTFQQIGDGIDQLQNQTLTTDQRQDIALALGIPQTILFANSANYATSMSDMRNFYKMTIIPRCEFIAEALNAQLLEPLGYHIEPSPESLEIFHEDENQRSASLAQLTSAGVPLLMAMDILGYDLTQEQRAELESKTEKQEERAEALAENIQRSEPETQEDSSEAEGEMKRWRRACYQALRKGHPLPIAWVPEFISPERAGYISDALRSAKTADDIRAAFAEPDGAIKVDVQLVRELQRANDLLEALR